MLLVLAGSSQEFKEHQEANPDVDMVELKELSQLGDGEITLVGSYENASIYNSNVFKNALIGILMKDDIKEEEEVPEGETFQDEDEDFDPFYTEEDH